MPLLQEWPCQLFGFPFSDQKELTCGAGGRILSAGPGAVPGAGPEAAARRSHGSHGQPKTGLWEMDSTATPRKGLPKDYSNSQHKGGSSIESSSGGRKQLKSGFRLYHPTNHVIRYKRPASHVQKSMALKRSCQLGFRPRGLDRFLVPKARPVCRPWVTWRRGFF